MQHLAVYDEYTPTRLRPPVAHDELVCNEGGCVRAEIAKVVVVRRSQIFYGVEAPRLSGYFDFDRVLGRRRGGDTLGPPSRGKCGGDSCSSSSSSFLQYDTKGERAINFDTCIAVS